MTAPAPGVIATEAVAFGVLAGGEARRLGGVDKAWVEFRGEPLILRTVRALLGPDGKTGTGRLLIAANREPERYRLLAATVVADRILGHPGPLAGLDVLLAVCPSPWLLTVPVDLRRLPNDLLVRLAEGAAPAGAVAEDDDGRQPTVALWHRDTCREPLSQALSGGDFAVHRLQARLGLSVVRFAGVRFGNLNTPEDMLDDGR